MLDPENLDAQELRAHGIGDNRTRNAPATDEELVAMVELLLALEVTFDEMVGIELPYLAGPPMVRPKPKVAGVGAGGGD